MAMAYERGWLNYQDKICKHWPEFAQKGKVKIKTIIWVYQFINFKLSSLDSIKSVCFKRKFIGFGDLKKPWKKYTNLTDDRLPQVDPIPQFKKPLASITN